MLEIWGGFLPYSEIPECHLLGPEAWLHGNLALVLQGPGQAQAHGQQQ